jgi:hypothetical protein
MRFREELLVNRYDGPIVPLLMIMMLPSHLVIIDPIIALRNTVTSVPYVK